MKKRGVNPVLIAVLGFLAGSVSIGLAATGLLQAGAGVLFSPSPTAPHTGNQPYVYVKTGDKSFHYVNVDQVDSPVALNGPLQGGDIRCAGQPFCVTNTTFAGGAKCDGVTDDSAAIQAAGNAAVNAGQTLANRFGTLYFPACDPGGSYRIATPVSWTMTQAGGASHAAHFKIKGNGLDGPLQIAVSSPNTALKATMTLMEWTYLEMEDIAIIGANGTYNSSSVLVGPANAKHAIELASDSGSVSVRNFQCMGVYTTDSYLHLVNGNHYVEGFIDDGCSSFGGSYTAGLLLDSVYTATVNKAYSFNEFRDGVHFRDGGGTPLGLIDYAGGGASVFIYISPVTISPPTQVKLSSVQVFGLRNTVAVQSYNVSAPSTVLRSLTIEDSNFTVNTVGVYVQAADSVTIRNTSFPLGSRRYIYQGISVGDSHILSVNSNLGVVTASAGLLEVLDSTLGPDTASPSGITYLGTGVASGRSNGTPFRMRVTDTAIIANTLVKGGTTAGRVKQFLTTDTASQMVGVALDVASGAAINIRVQETQGVQTQILSDGTTTIAPGDLVEPSASSNGRIRKGSTNPIGTAMSSAAAVADTLVDVL